jgi:hypothetical protein
LIQRGFLERGHAQNLQKRVERQLERQAFLDDGHEHVNRDGNSDLRFHRIFRSPIERFDPKVDPEKEQLNSPAQLIEQGDGQRRKDKIIGQEDQVAVVLAIVEPDPAQLVGESVVGIETRKENGLVADQVRRLIDGPRIQPAALKIRFGADDKEGLALMNEVETGKIEIGAVKDVETVGLGNQVIQDSDIVHFPVCYLDKRGDGASQIGKGMKLDGAFVFAEDGPGKSERQRSIVVESKA